MIKRQSIRLIRKRFPNQWLLIRIGKIDAATTKPLDGVLLAHSPDRDVIFRKSVSQKGLVFIDHSVDKLPKGYAVAF